jgi:hypothetical protein
MAVLIRMTLSIMTLDVNAECHFAVSFLLIVASESNMLIVIMLSISASSFCPPGLGEIENGHSGHYCLDVKITLIETIREILYKHLSS